MVFETSTLLIVVEMVVSTVAQCYSGLVKRLPLPQHIRGLPQPLLRADEQINQILNSVGPGTNTIKSASRPQFPLQCITNRPENLGLATVAMTQAGQRR